jgi:hypothetical protein
MAGSKRAKAKAKAGRHRGLPLRDREVRFADRCGVSALAVSGCSVCARSFTSTSMV